ncbi:MAG: DNA-directed RNA polymerase subunit D [Candidatus Micrarchaeota archaeon]
MKILNIKHEDGVLGFSIKDASVQFANALRRTAISQVPVFAIDSVTFYENSSSLFDEYIANRLALIPLKTAEGYKKDEVVLLSLDVEGPGTIYSKELKSSDSKIRVANNKIPVIKLLADQRLRLEAKARLGTAREHAKFQPGLVSYSINPKDRSIINFKVESFGNLPPSDIIAKSAEILEEKCEEFEKLLADLK